MTPFRKITDARLIAVMAELLELWAGTDHEIPPPAQADRVFHQMTRTFDSLHAGVRDEIMNSESTDAFEDLVRLAAHDVWHADHAKG